MNSTMNKVALNTDIERNIRNDERRRVLFKGIVDEGYKDARRQTKQKELQNLINTTIAEMEFHNKAAIECAEKIKELTEQMIKI